MVKLEFLSILVAFLLCASCSFAGDIPFKTPTSIGNYEYPKDAYIPKNFTLPPGNVFKFVVYAGGIIWYQCTDNDWVSIDFRNLYFNHKEDLADYPGSAVAAVNYKPDVSLDVISIIPKYDTSTMSLNLIASVPSFNPKEDFDYEFLAINGTTGKGAFTDITYIILTNTRGGATPDAKCGSKEYPEGFIYNVPFTSTILFYHKE